MFNLIIKLFIRHIYIIYNIHYNLQTVTLTILIKNVFIRKKNNENKSFS